MGIQFVLIAQTGTSSFKKMNTAIHIAHPYLLSIAWTNSVRFLIAADKAINTELCLLKPGKPLKQARMITWKYVAIMLLNPSIRHE